MSRLVEWITALPARRAARRTERRAARAERALRKAEAEAIRREHRRNAAGSGVDGGAV